MARLEDRLTNMEVELRALQLRVGELEKEVAKLADVLSSMVIKAHILDVKLRNFRELEQRLEEAEKVLRDAKRLGEDLRKVLAEVSDMQLRLVKKIEEKKLRGEDFENEIRELLQYPDTAFITVRELINRLLTALHINLPPELRPPLVNLKVGYDVVE